MLNVFGVSSVYTFGHSHAANSVYINAHYSLISPDLFSGLKS
jgi:hypothetical protein